MELLRFKIFKSVCDFEPRENLDIIVTVASIKIEFYEVNKIQFSI